MCVLITPNRTDQLDRKKNNNNKKKTKNKLNQIIERN